MKTWRLGSAGLVAAVLALALAPASWASRAETSTPATTQAGPVQIKVVTWNLGGETSKNWIADRVTGYGVTIFGAQQVDGREQYDKVLGALNTKQPGWTGKLYCPAGEGSGCDAFFTRGTIVDFLRIPYNAVGRHTQGAITARIDVGGVVVNYWVTHLESGSTDPAIHAVNAQQAQQLADYVRNVPTTIVTGDLNAVPFDTTRAYPKLVPLLSDSWNDADGPGYTTPSSGPNQRIDYLLYSPVGVQALGDQPLPEWSNHPGAVGSDHLPLLGTFNVSS